MTVTTTSNKITYLCNGITQTFTFPFACDLASDINVILTTLDGTTTLIPPNAYTLVINPKVSPNPTPVGGNVTYPLTGNPIGTGNKITIYRQKVPVQPNSFTNQGTLYPATIESSEDDLMMIQQQTQEVVGRALIVSVSDVPPKPLPTQAVRANMLAYFDANGDMIGITPSLAVSGIISGAMAPVVSATTLTIARAEMGLGSAAVANIGTNPGTVAAGDDPRIVNATTQSYVDGVAENIIDGYKAADIVQSNAIAAAFLPLTGGTLTGLLTLSTAPSQPLHAATKQYVDSVAGTGPPSGGASSAHDVSFVPTGGIAATNVQDALAELDTEKAALAQAGGVVVSATPPASPRDGLLWWESDSGLLYVRYNDGNTTQWVIACPQPDMAQIATLAYVDAADALKAPLASPVFTGNPQVPDQLLTDNDQSAANTKYVNAAIAAGQPLVATSLEFVSNSQPTKMLTPGAVWGAAGAVTLTDAPTVIPDLNAGLDFYWQITAAGRTLNNPTNAKPGQKGVIIINQDATGGRSVTSWGTAWKFPGGVKPSLSPSAGTVDVVSYVVYTPTFILCSFTAGLS